MLAQAEMESGNWEAADKVRYNSPRKVWFEGRGRINIKICETVFSRRWFGIQGWERS